nr:YeeE/YedE family protein [Streptomyces noursei]
MEGDLMRTRGAILLATIITGLALGYTVTNIGFGDYAELNRMFTFQDLRMFLSFAGAVVIIVCAFALLRVRRIPGRIHAGVIPGAVLFGTGWAISGGCPAIPIIQVASGYLPALITIVGVIVGIRLCRWANARYFHLDRGSCGL